MLQFPMFTAGLSGSVNGTGLTGLRQHAGLGGLPGGAEGVLAGFTGELQALLLQINPQIVQRLENLVAGGMELPQAARSLLADIGGPVGGSLFDQIVGVEQQALRSAPNRPVTPAVPSAQLALAQLVQGLGGEARGGSEPSQAPILLGHPPSAALTAQQSLGNPFPTQLTANLLDMGIPQEVGGRGWAQALTDRIVWMVQGDQQTARLKLNPPHLGPLEVRVSLSQDQASVSFLAPHAAVREALEAALPRLRELFDQQSLDLVRADIGDPNAGHERHAQGAAPARPGTAAPGDGDAPEPAGSSAIGVVSADGLIDLFA